MTALALEFDPDGTIVDFYARDGAGAFRREPAERQGPGAGLPGGGCPPTPPAPAPHPASAVEPRERRRPDLRAAPAAAGVRRASRTATPSAGSAPRPAAPRGSKNIGTKTGAKSWRA
ncbi:hypothetical protein SUDANB6_05569 [Streptomyces sp. enrichment culture]